MKKFKVIEESRFLNKQNLKQIVGGKCIGDTNFYNMRTRSTISWGILDQPYVPRTTSVGYL